MGYVPYSPPPLSEEELKRREENIKINAQREKVFKEMLLELYNLKNNSPNTLAVEKEKCGRPTYVKNYSIPSIVRNAEEEFNNLSKINWSKLSILEIKFILHIPIIIA